MFERTIIRDLRNWANKSNRKPLIIRGARQVGKTTLIFESKNIIRLSSGKEFTLLNLPYYYSGFIEKYLDDRKLVR